MRERAVCPAQQARLARDHLRLRHGQRALRVGERGPYACERLAAVARAVCECDQ